MTSACPPFTRAHVLPTIGRFLLGFAISLGVVSASLFFYGGLWVLWPVLLFLVLLQALVGGALHLIGWGIQRGWRAMRGLPPPPPPTAPPPPNRPWLTAYAGWIGFLLGGAWLLHGAWTDGILG